MPNIKAIITNPPYNSENKKVYYPKFITTGQLLNPKYLSYIIPTNFLKSSVSHECRQSLIKDNKLCIVKTFSKQLFDGVAITSGVMYFLWGSSYNGKCDYNGISIDTAQFDIFPSIDNIKVLSKIVSKDYDYVIPRRWFGIWYHNGLNKISDGQKYYDIGDGNVNLLTIQKTGIKIPDNIIPTNKDLIDKYKVVCKLFSNEATSPQYVLHDIKIIGPNWVSSHQYIIIEGFTDKSQADNCMSYFKTKFVRFLIADRITGFHVTNFSFKWVPKVDYTKPWTDEALYNMFNLSQEEIAHIEGTIKCLT